MKVVYDISAITKNILRAKELLGLPVVLMFKDFYEELANHLPDNLTDGCWSLNLAETNCYCLHSASFIHTGAVVVDVKNAEHLYENYGISRFYIPVDCGDGREGLNLKRAFHLADELTENSWAEVYGLITSGCMNAAAPTRAKLDRIWQVLSAASAEGLSLGGSYWIGREPLPDYVKEVRIGEYMLFGTIPYCTDDSKSGPNGVWIYAKVIAVYPERKELIVDCGYKYADLSKCVLQDSGVKFVDSSSEYSIFSYEKPLYKVGDTLHFIPNYKSLVTLRNARTEYQQ